MNNTYDRPIILFRFSHCSEESEDLLQSVCPCHSYFHGNSAKILGANWTWNHSQQHGFVALLLLVEVHAVELKVSFSHLEALAGQDLCLPDQCHF